MPIDSTKAILVVLVAAHEIKLRATVLRAPLNDMRQQHPAGRKLHMLAPDTRVIAPEFVFVIKVQRSRSFGAVDFEERQPEITALERVANGYRHLLAHFR